MKKYTAYNNHAQSPCFLNFREIMPAILVARYAGTLPASTLWRSSPAISSSEPGECRRDMQWALASLKGWDSTTSTHTKAKQLTGSPESLSPAKAINEWGWENLSILYFVAIESTCKKVSWPYIINRYSSQKWNNRSISIHSSHLSRWDALAVARWSFSHSPSCCNLKRTYKVHRRVCTQSWLLKALRRKPKKFQGYNQCMDTSLYIIYIYQLRSPNLIGLQSIPLRVKIQIVAWIDKI